MLLRRDKKTADRPESGKTKEKSTALMGGQPTGEGEEAPSMPYQPPRIEKKKEGQSQSRSNSDPGRNKIRASREKRRKDVGKQRLGRRILRKEQGVYPLGGGGGSLRPSPRIKGPAPRYREEIWGSSKNAHISKGTCQEGSGDPSGIGGHN